MRTILDMFRRIDYLLMLTTLLIGALSIIMINSITTGNSDYPKQVTIQVAAFIIGFAAMIVVMLIDIAYLERFFIGFYIASILIQLTVFIPGLGIEVYGSRAWISLLGVTTMQPSELVKITFVIAMAAYLDRYQNTLFTLSGFLLAFLYAIPIIGLVAYIDMGAGIILGVIFVGMVFAAGIRSKVFLRLAVAFIIAIPIIYRFLAPHQKERFEAFLHPENTEIEATYQVMQSKIAIGSGGIFGKGLGHGTIKESGFLPVQESDFIFSIVCEELGFVGGTAVIFVYGIMLWRVWRVVANAREVFGALLVVGFLCMFGFQIFENIGMTMGVMPITGITLPFLSAGGSSVFANMVAIGIILGVGARSKVRSYKHIST
ncbi:MAG: rod shape-determining protein RodA [Clostridiales Family XIII bacterium]|jgi:rod shape determining protein RodA|nr:rod shape-determining protein RodA [Clostridiales Family XIII bacterium]